MDILKEIGKYVVDNYEWGKIEQEVKKLSQKERKYVKLALQTLDGDNVNILDKNEATQVFESIKGKINQLPRKPARKLRKGIKKIKEKFKKRIGAAELVKKIKDKQINVQEKETIVILNDRDSTTIEDAAKILEDKFDEIEVSFFNKPGWQKRFVDLVSDFLDTISLDEIILMSVSFLESKKARVQNLDQLISKKLEMEISDGKVKLDQLPAGTRKKALSMLNQMIADELAEFHAGKIEQTPLANRYLNTLLRRKDFVPTKELGQQLLERGVRHFETLNKRKKITPSELAILLEETWNLIQHHRDKKVPKEIKTRLAKAAQKGSQIVGELHLDYSERPELLHVNKNLNKFSNLIADRTGVDAVRFKHDTTEAQKADARDAEYLAKHPNVDPEKYFEMKKRHRDW